MIKRAASALGWITAIGLLAGLGLVIGRTYVGTSPGPYGACYGTLGRPISCAVLRRIAAASDEKPGAPPIIRP